MRKTPLIMMLAFAVLLSAGIASAGKPRGKQAARVSLLSCRSSVDTGGRRVTFGARMRSTNGADKLELRFGLFQRLPGEKRWTNITDAQIGKPHRAKNVFLLRRQLTVTKLLAPASYRVVVRYRWQHGDRVVGRARRTSRACNQRVARPDLVARSLVVTPLPDDGSGQPKARYELTVANTGKGNADGFEVDFSLAGKTLISITVPKLGPGASITLSQMAQACTSGKRLTARVDPDDLIPERHEDNNTAKATCP